MCIIGFCFPSYAAVRQHWGGLQAELTVCAGVTSENVAAKYGISRDVQDKMAVSSHQRAAKARDSGRFKDEIVPVKTNWKDPKTGAILGSKTCCLRRKFTVKSAGGSRVLTLLSG